LFYEEFVDSYDDMIDWDHRFQAEIDPFKTIFSEHNVKSVLDAGCGTGMHAVVFSKLGLHVTGVDSNEAMLERAYENIKEYEAKNINLKLGDFRTLDQTVTGPFDAIVCLGNSLPHLTDDEDIITALKQFHDLLRPGGLLMLQMVHFDHYLDCADSAVAVSDGERNGKRVTFRRHYEFKGTKVIFHVSVFDRARRELLENYSAPLNAIRKDLLQTFMEQVGLTDIEMYRDFQRRPIESKERSFVVFARRPLELSEHSETE